MLQSGSSTLRVNCHRDNSRVAPFEVAVCSATQCCSLSLLLCGTILEDHDDVPPGILQGDATGGQYLCSRGLLVAGVVGAALEQGTDTIIKKAITL